MNNYEEIRNLLKASRTMLGGEKMVKESFEIKKRYGLILEQPETEDGKIDEPNNITKRDNPMDSIKRDIEYETADEGEPGDDKEEKKSEDFRTSQPASFRTSSRKHRR